MPNFDDLDLQPEPEVRTLRALGVSGATEKAVALMCDQGGGDWLQARLGRVTASQVASVVTSTGKPSKGDGRETYKYTLAAEILTGSAPETFVSNAMKQGTEREPHARRFYEMERSVDVIQCGFALPFPGAMWGYSPDGMCADRCIEIKCPTATTFVRHVHERFIPTGYRVQMQFGMWVTGLPLCDYVLYSRDRGLVPVIWAVERDEAVHAAFAEYVPAFCEEVAAVVESIKGKE